MNKIIVTLIAIVSVLHGAFSQDVITKKTGDDIQAKIIEVSQTEVKYKKFDNADGPTFTIAKSDILMVRYENGTNDVFNQADSQIDVQELRMKGKRDAKMNYKGKKTGAGWTAATTIVFTPLVGAIPAVACSSSEPSDRNLNYNDYELMQVYEYNQAYIEEAHKIKKRKVWSSFGISSGAWILLALLL